MSGSHRFYRCYRDVNLMMQWHDQNAACARKCTLNLCAAESTNCLSPPPKRQVTVLAHGTWDACDNFTFARHKKKFIKLISVHGWAMDCVTNCHCEEKKGKKITPVPILRFAQYHGHAAVPVLSDNFVAELLSCALTAHILRKGGRMKPVMLPDD